MALSQEQFDEVVKTLSTAHLDPKTLQEIIKILKACLKGGSVPGTPYNDIKGYTSQYKTTLAEKGSGVVQPDYENEMMVTYMDQQRVKRIFDLVPADGFLAAMPGVHTDNSGKQQFTISLLAANNDLSFVQNNLKMPCDGEEVWGNFDILKNFDTVFK
jgi:hypothetical protein